MDKILKRESLLYSIGHVLARLVSFLLLPLFTNLLSPYDYGIIALIYAFIGFFTVVLHLGLDTSLLRHYKPANNHDRIKFVTNAYIPILILNIIFLGFGIVIYKIFSIYILGNQNPIMWMMVVGILFADVLWAIPMIILRADNRPICFISYNLLNVISNIIFIYFFVICYQWEVFGVILSNFLSSTLLLLSTLHIVWSRISLSQINLTIFKQLFSFGSPFIFAGIFSMIIELSDRYIIRFLLDFDSLGIYNAGYKLGMLMLLVIMGFNMAWQPFFLDQKNKDNKNLIISIADTMFVIFSIIACGLILFVDPISKIQILNFQIIGVQFQESTNIVHWICIGYLLHGAYLLQLPGPYLTNNTFSIAIIRGVGAIINIILNFLLIPQLGIEGAAVATCLSFLIMAILIFIYNQTIYPMYYNVYSFIASVSVVVISVWISKQDPGIFIRLITFITIPCCMFLMGFFTNNVGELKAKIYSKND